MSSFLDETTKTLTDRSAVDKPLILIMLKNVSYKRELFNKYYSTSFYLFQLNELKSFDKILMKYQILYELLSY